MPPKEDNSAAPAAAAVAEDTGETSTANPTAAGGVDRQRAREEPVETQRVVRARQEVAEVPNWRWDSPVSDILLDRLKPDIENMGLRDFVIKYVREDYLIQQIDDYTMDVVVTNPHRYIPEELREAIEGREAFQQLRDARQARQQAMKDADILNGRGIVSLRQWKSTVDRDALNISAYAKGILDNAISVAEQTDNIRQLQEEIHQLKEELEKMKLSQQANATVLDGLFQSIYDAKWDYVVNNPNGDPARLWLEVKDGSSPPQDWSNEEVDYLTPAVNDADAAINRDENEVDFEDDEDNVQPTRECMQMKVLTSTQGWPYNSSSKEKKKILDCYITKEVERAWRFIKDDLFEWFDDPSKSEMNPRRRILIGTPGIGKSMAAGSYLLYQLLHYNVERLPVVAYFISGEMYIFDKTTKQVKMYDAVNNFAKVKQLALECNGYTIFDCSMEISIPKVTLPESWGTVLISSSNEKNFKIYYTQRTPTQIVVNCPTTSDLKAMHMWKQRNNNNTEEILSEWAVIKARAETLGPLPRFVFDDAMTTDRMDSVDVEINNITGWTADLYVGVSLETWATQKASHKLVMIFRRTTSILHRMDFYRNAPLSARIKCRLILQLAKRLDNNKFLKVVLFDANHAAWVALENYACGAFRNKEFVRKARDEIKQLKRVAPGVVERSCILQESLEAHPSKDPTSAPSVTMLCKSKTKMTIEFQKLYIPESRYFPLVDAFFFARSREGKTIVVGLQTTTASRHPTKTGTVCQFMNYLSNFDKWADHSTDFVIEIIYVQIQSATQIDKWLECPKVLGSIYSAERHEEAAKFWETRVFQYHLCLSNKLKEGFP